MTLYEFQMELRHLRYFVVAAAEENFNRAASRLNIAQPALSRQIRDLEEDLGVALFDRTVHRVKLSPVGRVFLDDALRILRDVEQARERAQRAARGQSGLIRIGFNRISGRQMMLPISLRAYRTAHPDVEIALSPLFAQKQIDALRAGQLDAGFFCFRPQDDPDFGHVHFGREEIVLALPRDNPLAAKPDLSLLDLADEPFVYFPRSFNALMYDHVIGQCMSGGLTPRIAQEAITEEALLSLVSVGMGVTFVGRSIRSPYEDLVTYRRLNGFSCFVDLELVWRRSGESSVLVNFIDTIRSALESSSTSNPVAESVS